MRCKALGVIVLLALAAVARPQDDAAKKDLKQMEGTWAVVLEEMDGKKATEENKKADVKLTVKDGKYTVHFGEKQVATGEIKLDAGKTPRQIDAVAADGEFKGKAMPGIYEVKGDTMRVCFAQPGQERPTEFRTKEGSGQMLLSYKRIKP
jgi:uncharacterized protein (TIGR03067 family)